MKLRAYGTLTDPGSVRPVNEDAVIAVPERALFGIADGYGGNGIGDAAAKAALEKVVFFVKNGLGDSEVTLPFIYRSYYTNSGNLLFNSFLYANEQLFLENQKKHINGRGGASVLFSFIVDGKMTIGSVGLCQAFLIRRARVQPLLKPRSYGAYRGTFQGSWNPKWAWPLAGFGHTKDLEPEIAELQLERGDMIIMSTDGVYPRLTEDDFIEAYKALRSSKSLDLGISEQNRRLMELAAQKGNVDNQSIISMIYE